jgi:hypothetical protein
MVGGEKIARCSVFRTLRIERPFDREASPSAPRVLHPAAGLRLDGRFVTFQADLSFPVFGHGPTLSFWTWLDAQFLDMARRSVFHGSTLSILSGRPHSPCCPLVTASPPPAGLPPSRPALLGSALRSVWFHFQWQLAAPSFLDLMLGSSRLGSSGTLCGAVRSTLAAVPWLALPLNIAPTLGACGSGCRAACWACVAVLGPPRTPRRGG